MRIFAVCMVQRLLIGCAFVLVGVASASAPATVVELLRGHQNQPPETIGPAAEDRYATAARMQFARAVALAESGKTGQAEALFKQLAETHPGWPGPANNLAAMYARQGNYIAARHWLERAINTRPAYATAYANLRDVYSALAAAAYRDALGSGEQPDQSPINLALVSELGATSAFGAASLIADATPKPESGAKVAIGPREVNQQASGATPSPKPQRDVLPGEADGAIALGKESDEELAKVESVAPVTAVPLMASTGSDASAIATTQARDQAALEPPASPVSDADELQQVVVSQSSTGQSVSAGAAAPADSANTQEIKVAVAPLPASASGESSAASSVLTGVAATTPQRGGELSQPAATSAGSSSASAADEAVESDRADGALVARTPTEKAVVTAGSSAQSSGSAVETNMELDSTSSQPESAAQVPIQTADGVLDAGSTGDQKSAPEEAVATLEPRNDAGPVAARRASARAVVERWRAAWDAQDVEAYLRTYASEFQPDSGTTRAQWRVSRRERLTAPARITIQLENIEIFPLSTTRLRVSFVQTYRSDTYSDHVLKTLILIKSPSGWQIFRETSIPYQT